MGAKIDASAATKMGDKSILLISRTPSVLNDVGSAVSAIPKAALTTHDATVFEMNGHAAEMALGNDIVIFETDAGRTDELGAINSLLEARDDRTTFIALTDGELPFAKARLLTRAGVDEVLPISALGEELPEVLQRSLRGKAPSAHVDVPGSRSQGSIIAVSQARGGVGATTVAVNLAYLLQEHRGLLRKEAHHRVALVDLDLQFGTVGMFLDIEDQGAMLQIATGGEPPDGTFLRTAMSQHKSGLSVLPAPAKPIPLDALDAEQVASLLDALRAEYDYVVVDLPRSLVSWMAPVLHRAGKMLIATDLTVPGVRHARRLVEFYTEDSPVLPIEIVVVGERRPMFLSSHHKEAAGVIERPLAHWLPHNGSAVEAMDQGRAVVEFHGGCDLSKAFRKLAKSVSTSLSAQPTASVSAN